MNKTTFLIINQGIMMFITGSFLFAYYYFVQIWLEPTKMITFSINSIGEANLEIILLTIISITLILWNIYGIYVIKKEKFIW